MAFFSTQQLAELSELNRIRNEAKEQKTKEDALPYTLASMLNLIDKTKLFNELKVKCAKMDRSLYGGEIRVDLFSFPSDLYRERGFTPKIYWTDLMTDTSLLERLSNLLGPGHFECHTRFTVMNPEDSVSTVIVWAKFFPTAREVCELECCHEARLWRLSRDDGLCTFCGSYTHDIMLPLESGMMTPPRRPSSVEPVAPPAPRRVRYTTES
jgi:hypothetical protein